MSETIPPPTARRARRSPDRRHWIRAHAIRMAIIDAIHVWIYQEELTFSQASKIMCCPARNVGRSRLKRMKLEELLDILEKTGHQFNFSITKVPHAWGGEGPPM